MIVRSEIFFSSRIKCLRFSEKYGFRRFHLFKIHLKIAYNFEKHTQKNFTVFIKIIFCGKQKLNGEKITHTISDENFKNGSGQKLVVHYVYYHITLYLSLKMKINKLKM